MKVDLHIHTFCSSGTQSPEEVVKEAASKGIEVISICDYDTIGAYEGLEPICNHYGVSFIKGVEIDTSSGRVLGYGFDIENKNLLELLTYNQNVFEQLDSELIEKMSKDYSNLSLEEFENYTKNPRGGGFKGSNYLKSKGLDGDYPEFVKYYNEYNINLREHANHFRTMKEVCDIIHNAGGYAVLTHVGVRMDKETFIQYSNVINEYGIDGLECYRVDHSEEMTKFLVEYAKEHNLLITGGGNGQGEWVKGGYGIGALNITLDQLNLGELLKNN